MLEHTSHNNTYRQASFFTPVIVVVNALFRQTTSTVLQVKYRAKNKRKRRKHYAPPFSYLVNLEILAFTTHH
jgi:hypothetical protein